MTTSQIAELLKLSTKTVESHKLNIKRHMQHESGPELARDAAQWVLENG
jgi:DNA-binding CsgD family transcriptional regulator